MDDELSELSRRWFLRQGVAAVGLTVESVKAVLAHSLQELTPVDKASHMDEGYWETICNQFLLEEGLAYLNTGTVGPTPRPVYGALVDYWRMMAENPNENSNILQGRAEMIREKAARFLGAATDEIAILRNATEGNNLLCHGIDLKQGDEVLIGMLEHDSNRQPWQLKARRHGVVIKEVSIGTPPRSAEQVLNAFNDALTTRTRVISVAHCDTVTGTYVPIKELAKMARSKDILCFVDGAQALGMVPLSVQGLGVDAYVTTCHKWLAAPAGTGLLYVRRDLHDRIWPNVVTENWWTHKDARKYDRLSRRPWPVVAALEDAIDFQLAIGRERIEQRMRSLASYLRTRAAEIPHVQLYTSNDASLSGGMTSLGLDNVPPARVREYLRQRYDVYVAARAKGNRYPADPHGVEGIRVSTHYYNTFEQIDRVLQGLAELASGKA